MGVRSKVSGSAGVRVTICACVCIMAEQKNAEREGAVALTLVFFSLSFQHFGSMVLNKILTDRIRRQRPEANQTSHIRCVQTSRISPRPVQ